MKSKIIVSLFAVCGMVGANGCGGDSSTGTTVDGTTVDGTSSSKTVASKLTLPQNTMAVAFDIDGDGTLDNRLGGIIQAVMAVGLAPQSAADTAISTGNLSLLVDETSTDATQQSAANAGVKIMLGLKPATAPKYDGTDSYTIDTNTAAGQFYGNIAAGVYTSNDPSKTVHPVNVTLELPLVEGQPALALPVVGARITFKASADGKTLSAGQINGAIKKTDVDAIIIPAVATLITAQLKLPNASASLKMFDTNNDGTVTAAEIMSNGLIAGLLAADVQMYTNGVYAPNPAKTTKDSLSLGLGFTAVGAKF